MLIQDCKNNAVEASKIKFFEFPIIIQENPYKILDTIPKIRYNTEEMFIFYIDFPYWYVAMSPHNLEHETFQTLLSKLPDHIAATIRANEAFIQPVLNECRADNYNFILDCYGHVRMGQYYPAHKPEVFQAYTPATIHGWKNVGVLPNILPEAMSELTLNQLLAQRGL